jgi:uncharacterized protein (TIGR02246 family)
MGNQRAIDADASANQLRELATLLFESWNRGDGQAFGSLFTPAAEYVTGAGQRVRGREAISQLIEQTAGAEVCLDGRPDVECDENRGQLRFAWSEVTASGGSRRGRITCTCILREGGWLIEALQNDETRGAATLR